MRRLALISLAIAAGFASEAGAHELITTRIIWTQHISRIFYKRCVSCHREGGSAFSLTRYREARPWAKAIKNQILIRRMPPWAAVKGFGHFRNDMSLSEREIAPDFELGGRRGSRGASDLHAGDAGRGSLCRTRAAAINRTGASRRRARRKTIASFGDSARISSRGGLAGSDRQDTRRNDAISHLAAGLSKALAAILLLSGAA